MRRQSGTNSVNDMNKDHNLYMNFWAPAWEEWGSGRDDSTMPWYSYYDWLEAYDWDETTDEFTLRFRDDFDYLNHDIWRPSNNWTFDQNHCTFMETHTYVADGKLILKMDTTLNPEQPNPDPPVEEPEEPEEPEDQDDPNDQDPDIPEETSAVSISLPAISLISSALAIVLS